MCEEWVTFMSSLHLFCFFLSSQLILCGCVRPSVTASVLNNLVAEETIKVPAEQAAKMLLITAVTLVADAV